MEKASYSETVTTDILENDERFYTFQRCFERETNQISKDNFPSASQTLASGASLANSSTKIGPDDSTSAKPAPRDKDPRILLKQNLEKTETITLMRNDFDEWASAINRPGVFEIRRDVESCLEEMGEVEDVNLADLFMRMATKSGMRITPQAAQSVEETFNPEKAQKLYLESQGVKNKVDKLKMDGGLYHSWTNKMKEMNGVK